MSWRGSNTTALDRVFACLPYVLPLISVLGFGLFLFNQFPFLTIFFLPIRPFVIIEQQIDSLLPGFGSLVIFLCLFLLVVRNENINHFIRFNTMQAILLDIVVFLASLIVRGINQIVGGFPNGLFIIEALSNMVFIGIVAACVYSIVQSLLGRYPEIPTISNAVYMQVPY